MQPFNDREGFIWLDGDMRPWREANVHVLTHSLHYGMAVFEGVRFYKQASADGGSAIFRLHDHTVRLLNSAKILGMQVDYTLDDLNAAQVEVVRAAGVEAGYLRPLIFYGSEGMGLTATNLKTHVAIAAWPWGAYLGEESLAKGIRVKTSSYTRHHINATLCRAKASGNYINSLMAKTEALRDGYDEALLLDANGLVMEGSGENFFMVKDGALHTPALTSCLDGITRNTIMTLARARGIDVVERAITRDEIYIADEAFFTGTAAEVTPIATYDHCTIGGGARGPITTQLQADYFEVVSGKMPAYADWLARA